MEDFGSALVPDFQQFYGLRLSEVVREWDPAEVLALIRGLPETSRYYARVSGEPHGQAWSRLDWLLMDVRNAVEALRALKINEHKKKSARPATFREWGHYPGAEAHQVAKKRRRRARQLSRARELAQASTQ